MFCFPTQIKVGTLCVKDNFIFYFFWKNIYIRGHLISRIQGTRESREINGSRILMGLQY